jgi:hypothetical protein
MSSHPESALPRRLGRIPVLACAALLLLAATGGPDCLRYLDWSRAAGSGDILELASPARSVLGVPLSQWSHGPGMLFALPQLLPWPYRLIPAEWLGPLDDFRGIGWLASLLLWWALWRSSGRILPGARGARVFLLAAGFLGTHLGFYSIQHASESLALATLATLTCWLIATPGRCARDAVVVGVLCGLLVMIRSHLVLYVFPAMVLLIRRLRANGNGAGSGRFLGYLGLALLPTICAAAQAAVVNRWMTGSMVLSPYDFGAGGFASLDWGRPELAAVLLHPWHGLLVYHPLYGVGFACLVAEAWRERSRPAGRFYMVLAATILIHVYLQASWYVWWMGVGTFGMRGLGVTAVPLLMVIGVVLARRISERRSVGGLATAILACCIWSFVLLCQGMTNFATLGELLSAQLHALGRIETAAPLAVVAGGACLWMLWTSDNPWGGPRRGTQDPFAACACCLAALAVLYLAGPPTAARAGLLPVRIVLAAAALTTLPFAVGGALRGRVGGHEPPPIPRRLPEQALPLALVAIFAASSLLFARLAVRTELRIAAGELDDAGDGAAARVDLRELEDALREYGTVAGFDHKKAALREYLSRERELQSGGVPGR